MNWKLIFLLYKKELLEFVRDRRTFLIMLLVPALLYPGLIIVTTELAAKQIASQAKKTYIVGVEKGFENSPLIKKIRDEKNLTVKAVNSKDFNKALKDKNFELAHIFIEAEDDYAAALSTKKSAGVKIYYQTADNNSRYAYDRSYDIMTEYSKELVQERLAKEGIGAEFIKPLEIKVEKVDKEVESRFIAGRILPGIMLVMLVVGCSFIAQEIGAGEKERGTLETVLCSPLSRLEMVCGKYLTVATVGLMSAIINLACMGLTFSQLASLLSSSKSSPFAGFSIPLSAIPSIFICLVMVAFLVSGMTLIASSLARTVQEAGQYMIPITLLLSMPVIFSSLPGVEFEGSIRFVPFLNFCLLFQNLLILKAGFIDVFYVIFSTAVFAVLVVYILMKIYNSEGALFNHEGRSTLSFNRSMLSPKSSPESDDSIICFLIMLPTMFFVSNGLQKYGIGTSVIVSQWGLFFLCTIIFMSYFKIDIKKSCSIKNPGAHNLAVCFLLTPFCFSAVILISYLLQKMGMSAPEADMDFLMGLLTDKYTFIGALIMISVTPAVCEEVFFRGLVLSGLRKEFSMKGCMILQAIMFGVAHYSIFRFVGTALMGAVLTFVIFRTGSIFCTIMMHMIFNSLSCLLWAYGFAADSAMEQFFKDWKIVIIIVTILGLGLFFLLKPQEEKKEEQLPDGAPDPG